MRDILKALFNNPVLANMLMALILLCGLAGGLTMVRESFPRFSLDAVTVTVAYPGADPEEIEEGVCLKLEEALNGLENVKKITCTANEGVGTALVECKEGSDVYKVKDDVKTQVDAITTFPVAAEKPVVQDIKFRGEVVCVVLWGDLPERQLKELAREVDDELKALPEVSQTIISGVRDYEISIEVPEERLRKYGLGFADLSAAVAKNGLNVPAGSVKTGGEDFRVRLKGRRYLAKDYRNVPVIHNQDGTIVTLGQLAVIRDVFDEDAKVFGQFNGKPAVNVDVLKTDEEDAIEISEAVGKYIERKQASLPPGVHLTKFRDFSRMITDRLGMLVSNGLSGLILVFFCLWLFLDLRLSFWVTMGIPISLAGALGIMAAFGGSINMLSMFGMIMVLGMIVDDAIVVGESIYSRRQEGAGCFDAAVDGTSAVALPVLAAVATTIVAFLPLFFIKGVMGKFIREIPIPVVAALAVSTVEALFILPVHLRHLPLLNAKPKRLFALPNLIRHHTIGAMDFFVARLYSPALELALRWRYATLSFAAGLLLLFGGMFQGGFIKFVFLPEADDDFVRAKVELPPGTPVEYTRLAGQRVLAAWREVERKHVPANGMPLTAGVYSMIGSSLDWTESSGQSNKLEVAVELLPSESRGIHYKDLALAWQEATGELPGAVATKFGSYNQGPGGMPIEIRLLGDDFEALREAADKLESKLKSIEGAFDVQTDYRSGQREFVLTMRPEAYKHGFTLESIASHVHGGFYGQEALRIQRDRDDVKVKIRYPERGGRDSIAQLKKLRVTAPDGSQVPLLSLVDVKLEEGRSTITRKNRNRVVAVTADIDNKKANAQEIISTLSKTFLPELASRHAVSYAIEGQSEETRDSLSSLAVGFPLALFGIYFLIASIFRSYLQPVVIMATIPFGLLGGVAGHLLFGLPLTLMSLFGLVALAGIVVNDAIVLIECVNGRLAAGTPLFTALVEAGQRRFRAIFLTSITTFFGLTPLILEKSMQAQFLIPMAIAIAFGVMFSTVVTLMLIPCVVAALNDFRRLLYFLWFLKMPTREEMEPRSRKPEAT